MGTKIKQKFTAISNSKKKLQKIAIKNGNDKSKILVFGTLIILCLLQSFTFFVGTAGRFVEKSHGLQDQGETVIRLKSMKNLSPKNS